MRRVIEFATRHLVAHWPERMRAVVLATGEAPDPAWLCAFRKRPHGIPVTVVVQSAFGYVSGSALDGRIQLGPPLLSKPPRAGATQAAQAEVLRKKLLSANLYPLLWNSRP